MFETICFLYKYINIGYNYNKFLCFNKYRMKLIIIDLFIQIYITNTSKILMSFNSFLHFYKPESAVIVYMLINISFLYPNQFI